MAKRFVMVSVIVGLFASSATTAEAEQIDRTVEVSYYGAQLLYDFRSCAVSGGAGCVSIQTRAGEESLTAKAVDAHGYPVSVWVVDAAQRADPTDGISEVYGTFCGQTYEPIQFDPGTKLEFWVGGEWWPRWWVLPEVDCFPAVATIGTIRVTFSGASTDSSESGPRSPRPGVSPSPEPSATAQPETVERSVDLESRRHLRSEGAIVADDASCRSRVSVVIQRKRSAEWIDVGSTTSDSDGAFVLELNDRAGSYRAVTPEVSFSNRTCGAATSPTVRHRH